MTTAADLTDDGIAIGEGLAHPFRDVHASPRKAACEDPPIDPRWGAAAARLLPHALSGVCRIECPPEVDDPKQGAQGIEAPADCLRPAAQPRVRKPKTKPAKPRLARYKCAMAIRRL
jgi:hypothetical protein